MSSARDYPLRAVAALVAVRVSASERDAPLRESGGPVSKPVEMWATLMSVGGAPEPRRGGESSVGAKATEPA
jgi:hypothetical protein